METLCYRLLIILLDPDEETDENRGKIDVGDHDLVSTLDTSLSSSSQSPFSPDDAGNEHNEENCFRKQRLCMGLQQSWKWLTRFWQNVGIITMCIVIKMDLHL